MPAPMKAAKMTTALGPNCEKRYIVTLDQDAAEIMGESRLRYVYLSESAALFMVNTLQSNLDAAHDDAARRSNL